MIDSKSESSATTLDPSLASIIDKVPWLHPTSKTEPNLACFAIQ